jgi:hypothetical protein
MEAQNLTKVEKPSPEKPKATRMPSEGQLFKLRDTKFRVVKSKGLRFVAVAIKDD